MSYPVKNGQTSNVWRIKLLDASSAVGAGLAGLTSASTGLIISTIANNEATATAYTVAGSTIETITTLGTFAAPTATKCRFKEVDATNHKGVYEVQFADARFAVASAKSLLISVSGATNLAQAEFVIPLVVNDPYVSLWSTAMAELSAIPAATGTVLQAITALFMALRNKRTTTATADTISNDAGTTIATAVLSDDGTTFTKNEYA